MTLETLLASVGVLGALQAAYLYVRTAEAKPVDGPSMWSDDSDFVVVSDEDRAARKMKREFDIARAKSIMAMAGEFAGSPAKA
jgi:hypothetical protein